MLKQTSEKDFEFNWPTFSKDHNYHKLFNLNTVKISYSCITNMADRIKDRNNKILYQHQQPSSTEQQLQTCNCKQKSECPSNENCKQQLKQTVLLKNTLNSRKATLKLAIETTLNLSTTKNTHWKMSYLNWYGRQKIKGSRTQSNGISYLMRQLTDEGHEGVICAQQKRCSSRWRVPLTLTREMSSCSVAATLKP